jgi:hypothetical protein
MKNIAGIRQRGTQIPSARPYQKNILKRKSRMKKDEPPGIPGGFPSPFFPLGMKTEQELYGYPAGESLRTYRPNTAGSPAHASRFSTSRVSYLGVPQGLMTVRISQNAAEFFSSSHSLRTTQTWRGIIRHLSVFLLCIPKGIQFTEASYLDPHGKIFSGFSPFILSGTR